MVTRKQEAVKKPRAWFGWFWRWLGWQVRTAGFFPFCLILVVLEAETEWIELCTWCCQIALLSPTRPLPVTHRKAAGSLLFSPFYMPATWVEMLEYVYRLICFFYRCLRGFTGLVWKGFTAPFQSLCNIWEGFHSAEDAAAFGVLHSLKPVGSLPI